MSSLHNRFNSSNQITREKYLNLICWAAIKTLLCSEIWSLKIRINTTKRYKQRRQVVTNLKLMRADKHRWGQSMGVTNRKQATTPAECSKTGKPELPLADPVSTLPTSLKHSGSLATQKGLKLKGITHSQPSRPTLRLAIRLLLGWSTRSCTIKMASRSKGQWLAKRAKL